MPSLQKPPENNVIWEMSFHWKEIDELTSFLCKFLELILPQKHKPSYILPWYAHLKNQIFQILWWSWSWKRSIKTNVDNAEQCWFTVLALHFRNNTVLPRKGVFQPSFRSIDWEWLWNFLLAPRINSLLLKICLKFGGAKNLTNN